MRKEKIFTLENCYRDDMDVYGFHFGKGEKAARDYTTTPVCVTQTGVLSPALPDEMPQMRSFGG